jgi:hypothetical protein
MKYILDNLIILFFILFIYYINNMFESLINYIRFNSTTVLYFLIFLIVLYILMIIFNVMYKNSEHFSPITKASINEGSLTKYYRDLKQRNIDSNIILRT